MGFGAGLGTKWKDSQSGKPDSAMSRNAIHGGGDSFNFRGEALVVEITVDRKQANLAVVPLC